MSIPLIIPGLTSPAIRDRTLRRDSSEMSKVNDVVENMMDREHCELPMVAHDGPCFVHFASGTVEDCCVCLKLLSSRMA